LLVKPLRRLDIPHPYAEIFQVQDLEDNSTSKVLKILKSNVPKLVDLFKQEAECLIELKDQGIPRAEEQFSLTLGNGQELHCLVMEKIEGENLEQWLKPNKQISQAQALEWMRQLVTILHDVHQKRFFHRDIKPSNIMHKPDGTLVLIDFGTAREVTQTVINGQDVTVVYSDGYTAPEQIQGHAVPQSDFFALGRTFVHLLTGKHPNYFSRDSQTRQLIWRSSASKEVSPKLADLIDDLIAPSVENRPQNTQVILQRIDKIIEPPRPSQGLMVVAGLALGLLVFGLSMLHGSPSSSIPQPQHQDDVNAVAFSPDGKYLVTASSDKTAKLWGMGSRSEPQTIQHKDSVVAVAFSSKGRYLATASLDKTAKIRDIASGNTITLEHQGGVVAVAFSPDEEKLATVSADGTAHVWTTSGKPIGSPLQHGAYVRTVTFSPDGKYLATGSLDNTARVWEITNGQEVKPVGQPLPHKDAVLAIAFSRDGKKLATVSADGIAQLWDVVSGKEAGRRLEHKNRVVAVAFSPDGKKLATVGADGIAQMWNATNRSQILSEQEDNVNAIAFSPDGKHLARVRRDNTIRVLEYKGSSYQEIACLQHKDRVVAVTFSPDGKYLATASWDNTARVWKVGNPHKIACQK
jgi:WD40 repeat protein